MAREASAGRLYSWTRLRAAWRAATGKTLLTRTLYHCVALTKWLPLPAASKDQGGLAAVMINDSDQVPHGCPDVFQNNCNRVVVVDLEQGMGSREAPRWRLQFKLAPAETADVRRGKAKKGKKHGSKGRPALHCATVQHSEV